MARLLKGILPVVVLLLLPAVSLFPVKLEYKIVPGMKYRIKIMVYQDIILNGQYHSSIESMNKALMEVLWVTNGIGFYRGKFNYYQKKLNSDQSLQLQTVYDSEFYRNKQGQMKVPPQFLMPTLRGIPAFPTNDLHTGDTWWADAEELHEGILSGAKNIFRFPINVHYTFMGLHTNIPGKLLAHIYIDYHAVHYPKGDPDVMSFTGFSHMDYYWDMAAGGPYGYTEEYSFMFAFHDGQTVLYKGTTEATVDYLTDITNEAKLTLKQEISNQLGPSSGANVKETPDSLIVNLGSILFDFNKATLKPEALPILDKVAEVLVKYPSLDIEVSGHTDNVGKPAYNLTLSELRAKVVTDYLILKGIDPDRLSYIGYGSDKPIAPNTTEEGRALNRRVEIKIMTKE
ncbi:MAG: hypothetical protein A2Y33_16445 [Spirochaetes bacterium GWF1_51_8]|nr:MAG: hypothetical protein A2Y33_16445 [Spirochaetes bacterium GWF1_51_8]